MIKRVKKIYMKKKVVLITKFDNIIGQDGILIMSLPEIPETKGILSGERIPLMKNTAYAINVGRGSSIDQDALIEALDQKRQTRCALNVMEPLPENHPLWNCPNIKITSQIT